MSNLYNMYPESSMWMNRTSRDAHEHDAPSRGGLGHAADYGVDADTWPVTASAETEQAETDRHTAKLVQESVHNYVNR